jgi:hypothetical protein
MKTFRKMLSASRRLSIGFLCLCAAVIVLTGCEMAQAPTQSVVQRGGDVSIERIRISALTEFVTDPALPDEVQLKVLLEFFDTSDLSISAPCILRFELYEFHSVSSDPRGKRLLIWPEKDLGNAENANKHWKNLLRGYEFYLPLDFMPRRDKKYVLEATCFAGQKRYNDLFKVQF